MKLSSSTFANAVAGAVIALLVVAAILVTNRLGFVGLLLLGCLTWLVCTRAAMDQKIPTWATSVFRAAMDRPRSPEERAAAAAEHEDTISPLRFYGWCGALLAILGAAGCLWQMWSHNPND